MTHDTDPTSAGETTEPDGEPVVARPVESSATDPGMPPIALADTDVDGAGPPVDRPILGYEANIEDPEVASILGRLVPARVAPPIGDTRETNGHDAAAGRISLRRPPRAAETPTPEAAVVLETTSPLAPVVVPDPLAAPRPSSSTTVPRARPVRPMVPILLLALAGGIAITTVVVILGIRGERERSSSPAESRTVGEAASSASGSAPSASTASESASPLSTQLPAPASPLASSAPAPAQMGAIHDVKPTPSPASVRAARPSGSSAPSATPGLPAKSAPTTPAPSTTPLPNDIKWSL